MLRDDAGYRIVDGDTGWWAPSGQVRCTPEDTASPADELTAAERHFFLPRRYTDPFGAATVVTYDPYDLMVLEVTDALGNRVTAGERDAAGTLTGHGNDYRVLQPILVMDANRNGPGSPTTRSAGRRHGGARQAGRGPWGSSRRL